MEVSAVRQNKDVIYRVAMTFSEMRFFKDKSCKVTMKINEIKKIAILRESHIRLITWFSCGSSILVELEFDVASCGSRKAENLEKNPQSKNSWGASALTTAPSLLQYILEGSSNALQ